MSHEEIRRRLSLIYEYLKSGTLILSLPNVVNGFSQNCRLVQLGVESDYNVFQFNYLIVDRRPVTTLDSVVGTAFHLSYSRYTYVHACVESVNLYLVSIQHYRNPLNHTEY